jgi:hypothetical protein
MKNYEIVDLILPEGYDKEEAKKELNKKYTKLFMDDEVLILLGDWLENNASKYLKELDAIENLPPKYDRVFWEQVIELNEENFDKISIRLEFSTYYDFKKIFFSNAVKENNNKSSSYFDLHELDFVNKQYRLLQEIAYSRLEGKNE